MERRRNARDGYTGDPRENPPASGIVPGSPGGPCRWSAASLGDLASPPPPLHSGTAPYSPRFTLIGSRDLAKKKRNTKINIFCVICDVEVGLEKKIAATEGAKVSTEGASFSHSPSRALSSELGQPTGRTLCDVKKPMRVIMEQRRNEGAGETGDPRENPPTSGIVRHDSHVRKSGVTLPGIELGSPWWEASRLTAQPPWPRGWATRRKCPRGESQEPLSADLHAERALLGCHNYIDDSIGCHRPGSHHRIVQCTSGRGGLVATLLTSHQGEMGSTPGGVAPGYADVEIVPDDAVGRRVFSGISRFPRPFHSGAAPYSPRSPSPALKTSMFRAVQISSLFNFKTVISVYLSHTWSSLNAFMNNLPENFAVILRHTQSKGVETKLKLCLRYRVFTGKDLSTSGLTLVLTLHVTSAGQTCGSTDYLDHTGNESTTLRAAVSHGVRNVELALKLSISPGAGIQLSNYYPRPTLSKRDCLLRWMSLTFVKLSYVKMSGHLFCRPGGKASVPGSIPLVVCHLSFHQADQPRVAHSRCVYSDERGVSEEIWTAHNIRVLRADEYEVSMEAGGTGDPRGNPPISGIVWHDSHLRKSGSDPAGYRTRFALVGVEQANRSATVAPCALRKRFR
ncbi:hypothetical protein PR048_007184 [Dryococelus australis]|uniref:Uncharacterized protein n=1 Tax=Dryococelus australis TaxID=614101 RepID=A0ABQ9ICW4_9NEOP|nr:hypothetical protein PR048_007184 [Dryococelus australis]